MSAENSLQDIRIWKCRKELGSDANETTISMYLNLRDDGDDHSTAIATVRGEIQMAKLIAKDKSKLA